MAYLIVLVLLVGVVAVVSRPLLRPRTGPPPPAAGFAADGDPAPPGDRFDLEAARDAKLREIRDAELDHQTGKLSDSDFDAIDSTLRAQAIEILDQLDQRAPPDLPDADGERLP